METNAIHSMNTMKMKNISIHLALLLGILILAGACDDEPTVTRSKNILIYGNQQAYIGDANSYTVAIYDKDAPYQWTVAGTGASASSGSGEFMDVTFSQLGTYTINVNSNDKSGTLEIDAVSKNLSLTGDTTTVIAADDMDPIAIPLTIDNVVAGETTIAYALGGTAVEGVDYIILSDNPIVLTPDSDEEEYYIYIQVLASGAAEERFITVTLKSVKTEIADEVVLSDSEESLTSGIRILP